MLIVMSPSSRRNRRESGRMRKRGTLVHKPRWVSWQIFTKIYANCPKDKVVDHIIPLKGKDVCGLHVPINLQYISKEENTKKGNNL